MKTSLFAFGIGDISKSFFFGAFHDAVARYFAHWCNCSIEVAVYGVLTADFAQVEVSY